mgnify:CR=1 FL=1
MQFFTGSPALSSFRLDKLLAEIRQKIPTANCIASHYIHFADINGELTAEESGVLQRLLEYGPAVSDSDCAGELFLVPPRAGTISPWSSKLISCGVCATREVSATLGKLLEKLDRIRAISGAVMSSVMPRRNSPDRSLW